jgi:hypothetical protein
MASHPRDQHRLPYKRDEFSEEYELEDLKSAGMRGVGLFEMPIRKVFHDLRPGG